MVEKSSPQTEEQVKKDIIERAKAEFGNFVFGTNVGDQQVIFRAPKPSELQQLDNTVRSQVIGNKTLDELSEDEIAALNIEHQQKTNVELCNLCILYPIRDTEKWNSLPPGFVFSLSEEIMRVSGYVAQGTVRL